MGYTAKYKNLLKQSRPPAWLDCIYQYSSQIPARLVKNNINKEELLRKYVNNECSPEELELVFEYLRSSQADPQLHALIETEAQNEMEADAPESGKDLPSEEMFSAIKQTIEQKRIAAYPRHTPHQSWFSLPWRLAAVITGILISAGIAYYLLGERSRQVVYTTGYGQTISLLLPDSSRVTLNGNSSIQYASNWNPTDPRQVWVKGEAFFSVKHTYNHQKFRVNTSDKLSIEVLGTEFNVYNRHTKTRVVLNSGKVTLNMQESDKQSRITMQPGELVEVKTNSSNYIKRGVNAEAYSSWINKKLILENTSFREIALLLEETYGLSVVVPDTSFYQERFSGIVPCGNADMLLRALSLSFNLNIQKTGNQVKFKTK